MHVVKLVFEGAKPWFNEQYRTLSDEIKESEYKAIVVIKKESQTLRTVHFETENYGDYVKFFDDVQDYYGSSCVSNGVDTVRIWQNSDDRLIIGGTEVQ